MSELTDLREQIERLGVPAHVHEAPGPEASCGNTEVCIWEPTTFVARVRAPEGGLSGDTGPRDRPEVEVDTMTAWGLLSNLPDDAGLDRLWAELVEVDNAE